MLLRIELLVGLIKRERVITARPSGGSRKLANRDSIADLVTC